MSLPDESARRAAWSAYWATGGLHSCVGSFGGNYGGAIGGFWRNVFSRLPATPVRALDLATGNGAIPLMLWEQRGQGGLLTVDAVDLAQLAPSWHRADQHAGIRFHAGVAMEAASSAGRGCPSMPCTPSVAHWAAVWRRFCSARV